MLHYNLQYTNLILNASNRIVVLSGDPFPMWNPWTMKGARKRMRGFRGNVKAAWVEGGKSRGTKKAADRL